MELKCFFIILFLPIFIEAQTITTYGGGSSSGFCEGCPATMYAITEPTRGVCDKMGNYYFASCLGGHRIRKISNSGTITTVAGNGTGAFAGDSGPANAASLTLPVSVKFDTSGNMYIGDFGNYRLRKVDVSTGIISTIAGVGTGGFNGDGIPANAAQFGVNDICLDTIGNIYIADYNGRRVRKIDATGIIHTIAGVGTVGYSGDGGPATAAELNPNGIAIDDTGNLYIADPYANVVRKINTAGIISTVAGNGAWVYAGDGIPATNAQIQPSHIAIDRSNNIYVGDGFNKMVFKITPSGILYRVAGNGIAGYSGDAGPATAAALDYPSGVSIDPCGNLLITEANNKCIRKVTFSPPTTATIAVTGISSSAIGSTVTVNATVSNAGSVYTVKWFRNSVLFSTTSTATTTYTKGPGIDTITARVVPAVTYCFDSSMSAAHYITVPVGVDDISGTTAVVNVYPNPAHDAITISSSGTLLHNVSISNLLGREVVYREGATAEIQIPIGHLPQGIYLVRVNGVYVRRFVKE